MRGLIVHVLSAACGVAWQVIVTLLVFGRLSLLSLELLEGAAAGMIAGALTVRSRTQNDGRECWLDLVFTYFAAVGAFGFTRAGLEWIVDGLLGGARVRLLDLLALHLIHGIYFAVLWAVVLVPLSFATRRFVWWAYQRQIGKPAGVQPA